MLAWIPALIRIGGYIVTYGPTVIDLIGKGIGLVGKIEDPATRADAAHDLVQAATVVGSRKDKHEALKEVLVRL